MSIIDPSTIRIEHCIDLDTLRGLLVLLLEPTPELNDLLAPSVHHRLTSLPELPKTFNAIIDICEEEAQKWTWAQKAGFLAGHPMIGEARGGLSGKEQSGGGATRPVVLAR